jgi:DNA-binding transcriptional ArsR family regulator
MPRVKDNSMFDELDPLLHSQVRLAIMSLLIGVKSAEFSYLLENINTTKGNLSFQLTKLKEAEYIEIKKTFKGNYPLTLCEVTQKGIDAYAVYVDALEQYFRKFKARKKA